MAMYGAFSSAMMGMMSQSTALNTIGNNIANVNTGGYKRTDTGFSTVLSQTIQHVSDIGGVKPQGMQRIDKGGVIVASERNLDTAVSGSGMYILNTELDGSGETFYTRDGSFSTVKGADISVTADDGVSTITSQEAHLVDKNGYYVMAWQPLPDGTFNTASPMSAMRVDAYAFQQNAIATTQATLDLNLPAGDVAGASHLYNLKVYDSNGVERAVTLDFVKQDVVNSWTVTPKWTDIPTAQVDTATYGGSVEAGDVYTLSAGGGSISYTALGTEPDINAIRDKLIALASANTAMSSNVTASAGGTGEIVLTANLAGSGFTTIANVTQGPPSVAQVNTVTLGGAFEVDDVFTVNINGTPISYTAIAADIDLDGVRNKLMGLVNGAALGVTATAGGAGELVLNADVAGTPFTVATATADGGGGGAQSATDFPTTPNYTALTDNTFAVANTVLNDDGSRTGTTTAVTFDAKAQIISPTSLAIDANWGGDTVATELDISAMTQYSGAFSPYGYWQNGFGSGQLREISFDSQGQVQGQFTNSLSRPLYRLGLAIFSNPNGMEMLNGNLFKETTESGSATIIAPNDSGHGTISGNAREMSNVDVAKEFTNMIVTQQAYNSAATVFRTVDEMTTTARDLKR